MKPQDLLLLLSAFRKILRIWPDDSMTAQMDIRIAEMTLESARETALRVDYAESVKDCEA